MYKKLIIAALLLAPYTAIPALAQSVDTPQSAAAPQSPGTTVNNNVTVPSAPVVTERVIERTNNTTNTTKVVPQSPTTVNYNTYNTTPAPVVDESNWPLVGIIAAIAIVFFGILLAAMSGGNGKSTTSRTTVIKS